MNVLNLIFFSSHAGKKDHYGIPFNPFSLPSNANVFVCVSCMCVYVCDIVLSLCLLSVEEQLNPKVQKIARIVRKL